MLKKFFIGVLFTFVFFYESVFAYADDFVTDEFNEPRIGVIILEKVNGNVIHKESVETVLNEKLLDLGFAQVLDVSHVIKIEDAQLLEEIYRDEEEFFAGETDNAVDYLIIGRCRRNSSDIYIPNHDEQVMEQSPLVNVKAVLKINVINYETGEIIGSFLTEGSGIDNNSSRAGDKAVEIVANKAAEKVAKILKNFH